MRAKTLWHKIRAGLSENAAPTLPALSADRFAVIDVETTGLFRCDRVIEVAVVTLDAQSGEVIDEFETLINPVRDPGPTWLHGISSTMLVDAPVFADIAHHLAARLDGAVVVGHNVRFDTRMLGREFDRAGIDVHWGDHLDTLGPTGAKLGSACAGYGILLGDAHRALSDARATGRLFVAVAQHFSGAHRPVVASPLDPRPPGHIATRDGYAAVTLDAPYLAALAQDINSDEEIAAYVTLLDAALADLRLTADERDELRVLAEDLRIDDHGRNRAHRDFVAGLAEAALRTQQVSDADLSVLLRVAALLDIEADVIVRRLSAVRVVPGVLALEPGMAVCFTGAAVDESGVLIDRATVLDTEARRHGLAILDNCLKSCRLLVAADTASQSRKMDAARRYGTPVAALSDYRAALRSGRPVPVLTAMPSPGLAQVCTECGSSWLAARRQRRGTCGECTQTSARTGSAVVTGSPSVR